MYNMKRSFIIILALAATAFTGCKKYLDVNKSPNSAEVVDPKLFTYVRYNVELSRAGLDSMILGDIRMKDVGPLDAFRHVDALRRIGQAAAGKVQKQHFTKFLI